MGEEANSTTSIDSVNSQPVIAETTTAPVNAGQNPAEAQQLQPTTATVDTSSQFGDELRNELKNYMSVPTDDATQQTPQQTESQPQQQTQPQQQEEQPQDEQQQQGESDSPVYRDSDGREVIPAIYIDELGRDVTLEEVLDKFKGFDYYHQNAQKQMEDAKRINEANAQLQRQKAELQQQIDEFNASKNDPMFKIVKLFQGDEELKQEVTKLVSRLRPNGYRGMLNQQRAQEQRQKFEAMQKEIENLKNIEIQRAQAIQQQQRNAQIGQTSVAIQGFVSKRLQELGDMGIKISESELKAIADSCKPIIQMQGYNYDAITQQFDNYFRMIANQSKQIINNYQSAKKAAPPAPPSGGATPTITPTPIRGREDFESMMASRLSQLLQKV